MRNAFIVTICILFCGVAACRDVTEPRIEFTRVPYPERGGSSALAMIEGRAVGAKPGQAIILYARSGDWYVQPFVEQPVTEIQPDSTWGNPTHLGTEYAALLVDQEFTPPTVTGALPQVGNLICESFAFDVGLPHLVQLALEGVGKIAPHVHVFSLNNADFSRDTAAVERMNNDPLIAKESQPAETARVLLLAADGLKKRMPEFKVPVLIIHGTADKATRYQGSEYFYEHAGSADKTLKLYEGHYHDLLNDTGREEVMANIKDWIDARIPAEASAVTGA